MSRTGMPSVMQTTRSSPASAASKMASAAKAAGTNMAETVAPVWAAASATVSKMGTRFSKQLAAFARSHAGHNLRAILEAELGVPGAEAAGDPLNEDFGVGLNQDGHKKGNELAMNSALGGCLRRYRRHHLLSGVSHGSGTDNGQPG
jgi:hypothetical protein